MVPQPNCHYHHTPQERPCKNSSNSASDRDSKLIGGMPRLLLVEVPTMRGGGGPPSGGWYTLTDGFRCAMGGGGGRGWYECAGGGVWRMEGVGDGNGEWATGIEVGLITIGEGLPLAEIEWMERAGEGASRLMTAGLIQPLELLASDVWLGPGVIVTGVHESVLLTSSSSSELSNVRSMTSAFLLPVTPETEADVGRAEVVGDTAVTAVFEDTAGLEITHALSFFSFRGVQLPSS